MLGFILHARMISLDPSCSNSSSAILQDLLASVIRQKIRTVRSKRNPSSARVTNIKTKNRGGGFLKAEAQEELEDTRRAVAAAKRRADGLDRRRRELEEEVATTRRALAEAEQNGEKLEGQRRGLGEELASERRAAAAAERTADRVEERQRGLEEELEAAVLRARRSEESVRELEDRLQVGRADGLRLRLQSCCMCLDVYGVGVSLNPAGAVRLTA